MADVDRQKWFDIRPHLKYKYPFRQFRKVESFITHVVALVAFEALQTTRATIIDRLIKLVQ